LGVVEAITPRRHKLLDPAVFNDLKIVKRLTLASQFRVGQVRWRIRERLGSWAITLAGRTVTGEAVFAP
jgi:hypothetical protein